jgi:hypothetical protein
MKTHSLSGISSKELRRALVLRLRIDSLEQKLQRVLGDRNTDSNGVVRRKSPPTRSMSAAGRARIAAAMKARWRKAKKAGKNSL